jgi:hypothetical protein
VSNSYYSFAGSVTPYTLARAEAVAVEFAAVSVAFDKLPSADDLQQNRLGFLTDTGSANVIVTAFPTAPTSYGLGMTLTLLAAATNTGATTMNVNGLGPKSVLRADGTALQAGDLPAGGIATFKYDGTAFRLTGGGAVAMSERIAAQAAAASALVSASTRANSTTTNTIASSGVKSWAIEVGKQYSIGQTLVVASRASPLNQMTGIILSDPTTGNITLQVQSSQGAGTFSDWVFGVTATAGGVTLGTVTGAGLASGGGNVATNQTITVTAATNADILAGTSTSVAVTPNAIKVAAGFQTLTDAATVAWDTNQGFNAAVTLGGNRTIANPTNLKDGWTYTLKLVQDVTGNRSITTWGSKWDWGSDGVPVLSAAGGKIDYVSALYDGVADKLVATFRKAA